MPETLNRPRKLRREPAPNPKRWTRKECEKLVKIGLLIGRYELVEGEIISKMGQNPSHALGIRLLIMWLVAVFGAEHVCIQSPIDVAKADNPTNEPEPDASVTSQPANAYADRLPGPADLLLVIEVSDSTLRFDLTTKADLYARAGIRDYWVMDILHRRIIAHRDPTPQGYGSIVAYNVNETISALSRPEESVNVASLLPQPGKEKASRTSNRRQPARDKG